MKTMVSKVAYISMITASLLFTTGCNDNSSTEAKKVEKSVEKNIKPQKEAKVHEEKIIDEVDENKKDIQEVKKVYEANNDIISEVFKDSAKIFPDNKQMILIFGTNTDPYTAKLKEDIKNSKVLQEKLKNEFSSYYFKAHENLRHKQFHEGQFMDVDTKTMIAVYGITATPTLIFTDKKGKAAIVVPGYMPTKQFEVTLNFIKEEKYKGKDRKNGEVYEALRDYYLKNGIDVRKKDK